MARYEGHQLLFPTNCAPGGGLHRPFRVGRCSDEIYQEFADLNREEPYLSGYRKWAQSWAIRHNPEFDNSPSPGIKVTGITAKRALFEATTHFIERWDEYANESLRT